MAGGADESTCTFSEDAASVILKPGLSRALAAEMVWGAVRSEIVTAMWDTVAAAGAAARERRLPAVVLRDGTGGGRSRGGWLEVVLAAGVVVDVGAGVVDDDGAGVVLLGAGVVLAGAGVVAVGVAGGGGGAEVCATAILSACMRRHAPGWAEAEEQQRTYQGELTASVAAAGAAVGPEAPRGRRALPTLRTEMPASVAIACLIRLKFAAERLVTPAGRVRAKRLVTLVDATASATEWESAAEYSDRRGGKGEAKKGR